MAIRTNIIAELMIKNDRDLPSRLLNEEATLDKLRCKNREIGSWIEDFEKAVLTDLLNSSDEYFFSKFPNLKSFTKFKRRKFAQEIEKHIKICGRCNLKVKQDEEWAETINNFFTNNRRKIKEIAKTDDNPSDPEHIYLSSSNQTKHQTNIKNKVAVSGKTSK